MIPGPIVFTSDQPSMRWGGPSDGLIFKKVPGKEGCTWLVVATLDDTEHVYVDQPSNRTGFAGSTLVFKLEDGSTFSSKGPWHSNTDQLLEETGIDLTQQHFTKGVIALEIDYQKGGYGLEKVTCRNVLHVDDAYVRGDLKRIEQLAQKYADELRVTVRVVSHSYGGSHGGWKNPSPITWEQVEAVVTDALLSLNLELPLEQVQTMVDALRLARKGLPHTDAIAALRQLSKDVEAHADRQNYWPRDHACRECVSWSDMLKDGFLCGRHAARALLAKAVAP